MNTVDFLIGGTHRMPSRSLFGANRIRDIREGVANGIAYFEDFTSFRYSANINAAVAHWTNGWEVFGSDGAALADALEVGGGIALSSDGDNEGASIGHMGKSFQISRDHFASAHEIRLKTSTIADTKHGFFYGLIDTAALSATVPIAAAGTLADENFVGWHRLEGDGDQVDFVYKANGVTQVSLITDALSGATIDGLTVPSALAADTYIKLGFMYVPTGHKNGSFTVQPTVNGIKLPTTYQVIAAAGTDFPNDVKMGPVFALLNATASTPGNTTIDWMGGYQFLTAGGE